MTRTVHESELNDVQPETFSLAHAFRIASKYKQTIWTAIAIVGLAYIIAALALFLLLPAQRVTTLDFRLEFRGAERGEYPNGTKFNPTEITSAPILVKVYVDNALDRYIKFDRFKSSVFVMQSNEELQALTEKYRAKLSDPKLTTVERDQLEKEFQEKKAVLSQAGYTIGLTTMNRFRSVPNSLRPKILSDILSTWADTTVKDKGVSLYDISILSSGVFERDRLQSYDYIIGLDMVRSKIIRVLANIDDLTKLPGAKVLRTSNGGRSLAEIRVRLSDTLDFRLRPLIGVILAKGISKNPTASFEFLKTQLKFNELETAEASARVDAVRDALDTYIQEKQKQAGNVGSRPESTGSVIPQIDESFLNRIVELTGEASDLEYRQKLVDDLREESMRVVPLQAEARYYQTMLDSFKGTLRPATKEEGQLIEEQMEAIVADAVQNTADVNQIYEALSKDLNPSTILYSVTDPASTEVDRPLSAITLLIVGVLLLLLALPASMIAAVIYENAQVEESDEVAADPAIGIGATGATDAP